MTSEYLIKGLIIGFSIAAPVGPIGVLTIKRTLVEGRISGFVTGMGAALADAAYGAVAGFGLIAISSFLISQGFVIKLTGGLFLLYLGTRSFLSKPSSKDSTAPSNGLLNNFVSTFFLTLTNPSTILSFIAIFAGLGLASSTAGYYSSTAIVFGVFIGSALWWFILSFIVSYFREKITVDRFIWVNRLSGIVLVAFGVLALYSLLV
jgi:threonine/homoserine/homoserine lactone efflux protein